MAFLPYVPIGLDLIDRIYRIVARIRGNKQPAKTKELVEVQDDLALLKEAVQLQAQMFQQRETNLTECVEALERQVRGLRFQVWGLGLVLIGYVIFMATRT